jgi:hypothetical protein
MDLRGGLIHAMYRLFGWISCTSTTNMEHIDALVHVGTSTIVLVPYRDSLSTNTS